MNPPIRYFGGKSNMKNEIRKYFPTDGSYNIYVEPFGGSYSIGLSYCGDVPCEIYNDLNRNVYALYSVLQDDVLYQEFKRLCDLTIYSEDLRKEYMENLKGDGLTNVERAYQFFYVNRTSHNGIGGFSCNTIVRRNMCKSVSDMLSAIDRMDALHQRMSKVVVLNRDAISLVEKYCDENVFLYCDPPYVWDTRGEARYDVDMSNEQHMRFIETCLKSKAKILISGYDHPLYDRFVDNGWEKIQFDVKTVSGTMQPKTKTETLWRNYKDLNHEKGERICGDKMQGLW